MELRTAASPVDVSNYTTKRLREEFLIPDIFMNNEIKMVYSHIDRIITGGIMPVTQNALSDSWRGAPDRVFSPETGAGRHKHWRLRNHHCRRKRI